MYEKMISVCLVGFPAKFPVIVQTEDYNIGESVEAAEIPAYIIKRAKEGNITKVILYGNQPLGEHIATLVKELDENLEIEVK